MSFAPGTILMGKYRVDGALGTGGYGTVIRAHHLLAQQEVAIKILRDDMEMDEENRERFLREAQAMVRLRSEHVAKISDVGTLESGAPYVVMELLDGMDLGRVLETTQRVGARIAVDHLLQACDVLAEAHALGIVHRDIKPTNLFVTRRRDGSTSIKVLDFGISKTPSTEEMKLTQTATMLGTPAYMSPEQMRSARTVDARTDIWALGVVLYELVEGRMPYPADSFAELAVMVATEAPAAMTVAPELAPIVMRCLAKSPNDRYQTVADLAVDFARFATPETAHAYVARIHRMLGRAPGLPSPVPGTLTTGDPLLATQLVRRPGNGKRRLWLPVVIGVGVGVAAIVGVIAATSGGHAIGNREAEPGIRNSGSASLSPIPSPTPMPTPTPPPNPNPTPSPSPTPSPGLAASPGSAPAAGPIRETKKPPKTAPATHETTHETPAKPKCDIYHQFNGKCV